MKIYWVHICALILTGLVLSNNIAASEQSVDARILTSFDESYLGDYRKSKSGSYLAYRFIWLRTFHDDMVFRVVLNNDKEIPYVEVKKISKKTKKIIYDNRKDLSLVEISNIKSFSEPINFFILPERDNKVGFDGAQWILEEVSGDRYHYAERVSPLPPYYSSIEDPVTHEMIPNPNESKELQYKHSDEISMNMFCMLIMFLQPGFNEEIY